MARKSTTLFEDVQPTSMQIGVGNQTWDTRDFTQERAKPSRVQLAYTELSLLTHLRTVEHLPQVSGIWVEAFVPQVAFIVWPLTLYGICPFGREKSGSVNPAQCTVGEDGCARV
jgi:hypothetical protein